MTERWLPIAGWEGFYSASDLGRIRSEVRQIRMGNGNSIHTVGGVILTPWMSRTGYLLVALARGGKKTPKLVHRLVIETFIGPCPDGMECCHRDSDKSNNRLENLRWDTRSENQIDRIENGDHHQVNKTHCPYGHPYDEANTYFRKTASGRPQRGCRACRSRQAAECKARKAKTVAT